jgi:hypothetical protein
MRSEESIERQDKIKWNVTPSPSRMKWLEMFCDLRSTWCIGDCLK